MKGKNFTISALLLVFVLSLIPSSGIASKKSIEKAKEEEAIYVPKEIKKVLKQGLATRQGRQDIPFTIIKQFYFPAQENMHSIFIFKVKNKDLGFAPPAVVQSRKRGEKKTETPSDQLQASLKIFIQFHRMKKKTPAEVVKEIYIPGNFSIESSSYDPDKEEFYTIGYPMPAGEYLMAMAITSPDLKKIGTLYYEFSLPDQYSFAKGLETTPILFLKGIKQMSEPEITVMVHKDYFTYSTLQIEPMIENVFSPGGILDIFFFIFGTQPDEVGKFNIEITYEVIKEGEKIIHFEPKTYNHPFISQPLPLKKTVLMKPKDEEERREAQNLESGQYTLSIAIKDILSRKSLKKDIDFEIR